MRKNDIAGRKDAGIVGYGDGAACVYIQLVLGAQTAFLQLSQQNIAAFAPRRSYAARFQTVADKLGTQLIFFGVPMRFCILQRFADIIRTCSRDRIVRNAEIVSRNVSLDCVDAVDTAVPGR